MENTEFSTNDRLKISPRAYALALQKNVDITKVIPTGPNGRIIEADILRAAEKKAEPEEMPKMKTVVIKKKAEKTTQPKAEKAEEEPAQEKENLQTAEEKPQETVAKPVDEPADAHEENAIVKAPETAVADDSPKKEKKNTAKEKTYREEDVYRHTDVIIQGDEHADSTPVTIEMSFDATALVSLREKIKENGEVMGLPSATINDMILFATAKILKKHRALNAHFLGDKIRYFEGAHISFAVDTDRGPQTLTVFDADRLSLSALSKITGTLVRGARAGGTSPEKNQHVGSFTVINVAPLGIERYSPVLHLPQTGVLGVCASTERMKTVNGEITLYPAIPMSLTYDPRAISMANAAEFMRDLCAALENFNLLLMK